MLTFAIFAITLIKVIIDIILVIIFIAGIVILWHRLSARIPELIAVPDQVITARLEEDSARVRLFIMHLKVYYREKRYEETFFRILGKAFYRVHIILLRLDNGAVNWLKKIRAKQGVNGGNGNGVLSRDAMPDNLSDNFPPHSFSGSRPPVFADENKYWKRLKMEPAPSQKEANRIQEIKIK